MQLLLPILSGLLMALSMPGASLGCLAFIGLVPLLLALRDKSPRESLKLGYIGGATFGIVLFYWIYALWEWISVLAIPTHLLMAVYMGIFWAVFGWGYAHLRDRLPTWTLVVVAPALWVSLEYIRSLTILGFPWGQAADALTIDSLLPFAQIAGYAGIWGASFLVVLINLLIYAVVAKRQYAYGVAVSAILVIAFIWGSHSLSPYESEAEEIEIAMLQPSIPQIERSKPENLYVSLGIYKTLLDEVVASGRELDLVVLPESALQAYVLDQSDLRDYFVTWASSTETPILMGTFTQSFDSEYNITRSYNSTAFISESGPLEQIYSKIQLVPFSTEYFPGIEVIKAAGVTAFFPMIERLGRLSPGESYSPLDTPLGLLGTPICFETIFPHITRKFVRNGAEVIMTVTNDAWFHKTWALPQHFKKGVYRAIESGRYFVQTANSGISGIIDPHGKIKERSRIEDRSITYGSFSTLNHETFYVQYGDWLPYVSLVIVLLSSFSALFRRGGRSPSPASSTE